MPGHKRLKLKSARELVLQNFDTRHAVKLSEEAARGGGMVATAAFRLGGAWKRDHEEGRMRWLSTRIARTASQLTDKRAKREAAAGARLSKWLDSAG